MTEDEAWADFAQMCANWLLRGHGLFTVEIGGRPAGFVVLGAEPGDREHELGFMMSDAAEGRGLALDAAAAVRDWAWRDLGLPTLVSYVDASNTRSAALARRLGAARDPAAEAAIGPGIEVWRHPRPTAQARDTPRSDPETAT